MCLWFKVSLPPLTSIKKACSFKSILCPDAYNKKLSLIISFTSKKKAGKKAKSRTKSLVSYLILGKPVIADYGNYRIYKITDLDFTKSPMNHVQINNAP